MDDRAAQDQKVVRAVLAGDRNAFADLVTRYQKLVASVAWRPLGNAQSRYRPLDSRPEIAGPFDFQTS